MTRKLATVFLFLFALVPFSINCGGSNPAPVPSPTTTSVTVNSSASQLFLGASEVFSATATLSNGSTAQVTGAVWSSDAPNVAQVESATGRVTGVASGNANVSVDYQGLRGTKLIRVLPNYQGTWLGTYLIGTCTETLDFQTTGFCAAVFPVGQVRPLTLLFAQSGTTLSGSTALGQILSNFATAPVAADGSVVLPAVAIFGTTTFTETWVINVLQPGRIVGTLHVVVTDSTIAGTGTMDATLGTTSLQSLARVLGVNRRQAADSPFDLRMLAELMIRPSQ
jgi:hypothetical protein